MSPVKTQETSSNEPVRVISSGRSMRSAAFAAALMVSIFSAFNMLSITRAAPGDPDGVWYEITPAQISTNFNSPPDNYGVQSIAIDPNNTSIVYFAARAQGLWKTTNAGVTWSKVNTGTGGNMLDIGMPWALVVDPFNSSTLWATSGYGAGGPLKSTDGGVSWTKLPVGGPTQSDDVGQIRLDPNLQGHMIIAWHSPWSTDGTNAGVSESLNGGTSWIHHYPPAGANWGAFLGVWFLENSQTWLLGSQTNGLWRTTNSGTTWTQISTIPSTHGGGDSLRKIGNNYYFARQGRVDMSTDNGVTWTNISTGLPGDYFGSIANDGTNMYIAPYFPVNGSSYIDGPWYKRPISGGNWTTMTNSPNTCRVLNGVRTCNGPALSVYDPVNHIAYTANGTGGVWKLREFGSTTPGDPGRILDLRDFEAEDMYFTTPVVAGSDPNASNGSYIQF